MSAFALSREAVEQLIDTATPTFGTPWRRPMTRTGTSTRIAKTLGNRVGHAGVTVEFKTVESPSIRAIRDNIRRLGKQSAHGIVDLRAAGVNKEMAREALARVIGRSGRRLAQILLVLTDDEYLEWRNGH